MNLDVKPGKYVIAVSGGVDSVVLLHLLSHRQNLELIIAHFDHGIRQNTVKEINYVSDLAANYGFKFELGHGKLGPSASEDQARKARYSFLSLVAKKHKAKAIITAHHQDDVIETAIINLIRGTKRRGFSSLNSTNKIIRPLLGTSKKQILEYAKKNNLVWVEDVTNSDQKYLRNWVRINILPKIDQEPKNRKKIISMINQNRRIDDLIRKDIEILSQKHLKNDHNRKEFIKLPDAVGRELLAERLRCEGLENLNSRTLDILSAYIKTGSAKTKKNIAGELHINLEKDRYYITKTKVTRL